MKYRFNVTLSEKDYYDFNEFILIKSPYGKREILFIRIAMAVILIALIFISLFSQGVTPEAFIDVIPYLLLLLIFELGILPFLRFTIKGQLKSAKKSGKLPYSPAAVVEIYDDRFVEITDGNRTEFAYSAVERVSVIHEKFIYIHVNRAMAYLIPAAVFESKTQYVEFIEFLKSKYLTLDFYNK